MFVANTNSNTVSVIDTTKNKVVQTINTQPWPEASVGYEPDGITVTNDGHLLVTLGRANAVAVYRLGKAHDPVSYVGLLPTDYFPAGHRHGRQPDRGVQHPGHRRPPPHHRAGHGTHDTTSSLTRFTLPSDQAIRGYTAKVFSSNGWNNDNVQYAKGNGGQADPGPGADR